MSTPDLTGKTLLITGANSGIGLIAAKALARMGGEIVMICRSPDKGAAALAEVKAAAGHDRVRLVRCDLSSLASVRAAGAELAALPRIDVLLNNAGAYNAERRTTADGLELTFGANHIGPFLLTQLLLERLKATGASRVINVASAAHLGGKLVWDDLGYERRGYQALRAYCDSKLMNILFTRALARRLEGSGVVTHSLHPGAVATNFAVNDTGAFAFLARIGSIFLLSPEQGAATSIALCSEPAVGEKNGLYWSSRRPAWCGPQARDDDAAERLWALSEELVGRL
jgi:NAD(P)-dependent dehydrogenase (short-subunit alcohol dehydrogenase family)